MENILLEHVSQQQQQTAASRATLIANKKANATSRMSKSTLNDLTVDRTPIN